MNAVQPQHIRIPLHAALMLLQVLLILYNVDRMHSRFARHLERVFLRQRGQVTAVWKSEDAAVRSRGQAQCSSTRPCRRQPSDSATHRRQNPRGERHYQHLVGKQGRRHLQCHCVSPRLPAWNVITNVDERTPFSLAVYKSLNAHMFVCL